MKILFWNTGKNKQINKIITKIIIEKDVSVIVLAEYEDDIQNLCNLLAIEKKEYKFLPIFACDRIKMIVKQEYRVEKIREQSFYSIQSIDYFNKKILLVGTHFPSKLFSSDEEQKAIARELKNDIEEAEKFVRNSNTIIVGDLNSNPFEGTCVNADCLHGIPIVNIAKKRTRIVNKKQYSMFYNPMWKLYGRQYPYGTYYYNTSKIINYYWNLFDQVLIRPDVIKAFVEESLEIVHNVSDIALLSASGIPNKEEVSDHLPICFEIKEEKLND